MLFEESNVERDYSDDDDGDDDSEIQHSSDDFERHTHQQQSPSALLGNTSTICVT
jgi:hypothetical protein